jgi:antitoxin PrlF
MTSKGQVTIPKAVRDALQLRPGSRLAFVVHDADEVVMTPLSKSVDEVFGRLQQPGQPRRSVEQMNAAIRRRMKARQT